MNQSMRVLFVDPISLHYAELLIALVLENSLG